MNKQQEKQQSLFRRRLRVRTKIQGTAERPRLTVHKSLRFITAQVIDDVAGKTLAAADDRTIAKGTKTERAVAVGKAIAEKAKAAGVKSVVFDRAGQKYQGRIQAVADGAREGGLEF